MLRLATEQSSDRTTRRSREVVDETVHYLLREHHIVAVRKIDDDVGRHGLVDILPGNERIGNQTVLLDSDLVTLPLAISVRNAEANGTIRGTELATVLGGASSRKRNRNRIDGHCLWVCKQGNTLS